MRLPKGSTMQEFLNKCREQQVALRACSAADLMYVKEDLIMPHHVTFYELIIGKARGKSGPLFHFDVHDDGPLAAFQGRPLHRAPAPAALAAHHARAPLLYGRAGASTLVGLALHHTRRAAVLGGSRS